MLLFWLIGCTERTVLDFDATCAGVWPADDCAGDCADNEVEARWLAVFSDALPETARDHARVRSIEAGSFDAIAVAIVEFDIDWVRVIDEVVLSPVGAEPADAALVEAWRGDLRVPAIDLDARLMSFEDAQALVAECEAELGVVLDAEGWCAPWYPTDPDDDGTGLRFDFTAPLGGPTYAEASIDVTRAEAPRCHTNEIAGP